MAIFYKKLVLILLNSQRQNYSIFYTSCTLGHETTSMHPYSSRAFRPYQVHKGGIVIPKISNPTNKTKQNKQVSFLIDRFFHFFSPKLKAHLLFNFLPTKPCQGTNHQLIQFFFLHVVVSIFAQTKGHRK
jgi:hypothetical protein